MKISVKTPSLASLHIVEEQVAPESFVVVNYATADGGQKGDFMGLYESEYFTAGNESPTR